MSRAFEIGRRLAEPLSAARGAMEALHRATHPMFLVAPDGALAFANTAGEILLAANRGLLVLGGRLTSAHADSARQLEALLAKAAHRGGPRSGGAMSVPNPAGGLPLALRTTPMPLNDGAVNFASAPVLVSVTDLESEVRAPEEDLRLMFGLTAAEARLAAAVFDGLTLPEAADQFGVSVNTTRFQLARVFEKTGVTRQAELVKLMMRLAAAPRS